MNVKKAPSSLEAKVEKNLYVKSSTSDNLLVWCCLSMRRATTMKSVTSNGTIYLNYDGGQNAPLKKPGCSPTPLVSSTPPERSGSCPKAGQNLMHLPPHTLPLAGVHLWQMHLATNRPLGVYWVPASKRICYIMSKGEWFFCERSFLE